MATFNPDHYPDVFGQLPRLKTYTHYLLAFPIREEQSPSKIVQRLHEAAKTLVDAFPWLACRVIHENAGPGNSGVFRLEECAEFAFPNSILHFKDCTSLCPSYQELIAAKGPTTMLDSKHFGPLRGFPHIYSDDEVNPAPVFTLRANLIEGGLLLDFVAQHNIIDGSGILRLIEYLAKTLRDEPFTREEILHGNRDRTNLVELLPPGEPMVDHSHLIREALPAKPITTPTTGFNPIWDLLPAWLQNLFYSPSIPPTVPSPAAPGSQAKWHFVRLPPSTISHLKVLANSSFPSSSGLFVSTNDAISGYLWQSISAVRLARRQTPSSLCKFSRALDARRALGIPREYLGQLGYNATCHLTFSQLQSMSLGEVALHLRQATQKVNNEHAVRSFATLVAKEKDKSKIFFGGAFDPDKDLGMSSVIHASVAGCDFGKGLGKPGLVRRPLFAPLEGCVYLWNMTEEGEVDVLMCLKEVDWEGLAGLEGWKGMVEFIG
ncbi:hypothetical protein QBC44DRAFT_378701 [Cladorrhinum sp. PSN332]|nr:hypothetical protein QBC44DRAFT_378701 [Cladorrhinum sp. PSN332]